ncbi:NAD(P)/FAD-dependent oxidoreductase [Cohnella sp. CFH 77786]|uniref:NAD(P)/FAD-dependent oxidoreductase n=1 Tax=Cohnella sp. CFH 77786 TaxID=2662265 RepID=UPI001C60EC1E|nr:NAD(P)/FAD-dependent oxidoreductase [Cohnella sp. CFH 77786]MBW5447492.1 NAD(P)/FAD-dependent oxidoreductase [Cohnella sp. CFH 77786]
MKSEYDVIVVGARVAGSTLAYEMAQEGFEVLLLDENLFPSDTLCIPNLYGNSLAMLKEMGVLDRLLESGSPLYSRARLNIDGAEIEGVIPGGAEASSCLCVRRLILDRTLLDHAKAQAGVTVLEGFKVMGLVRENGTVAGVVGQNLDGRAVSFTAHMVVGADGRRSRVREMAGCARKASQPSNGAFCVAYVSGYAEEGEPRSEFYQRRDRTAAVYPAGGGRHVIGVTYPLESSSWSPRFSAHAETAFRAFISEEFGDTALPRRLAKAVFEDRIRGLHGFENFWYQGMGKGWALVGDAMTFKDPRLGQGIHDALYGSRLLAAILADYDPKIWGPNGELIGRVYQSAMEKKLMSRFRQACRIAGGRAFFPEKTAVYRLLGADPEATATLLGTYNYMNDPADVEREIDRLLSSANRIP